MYSTFTGVLTLRRNKQHSSWKGSALTADEEAARTLLAQPLLQRFIGVQYKPKTELQSHYQLYKASEQFDMLIHG